MCRRRISSFHACKCCFLFVHLISARTQRGTIPASPSQLSAKLTEGQPLSTFIISPPNSWTWKTHTGNKAGTRNTPARKYTNSRHRLYEWTGSKRAHVYEDARSTYGHFHYVYFSNKGYQMKRWFPNAPVPGSRDIRDKSANFPLRSASRSLTHTGQVHSKTEV